MRALPLAIVVSTAVHTGALAWVATHPAERHEPPRLVTIEPIHIVPKMEGAGFTPAPGVAESEPTVVALLDDHSVATTGPGASPSRDRHGAAQRIATTSSRVEIPPAKVEMPPKHSALMTMRHPKVEAGLSADFMARFDARSPPIIDQSIAGVESRLGNPSWVTNASPDELTAERAKLVAMRDEAANAELKPDGAGTKADHQTFRARFNPDGTARHIEDKANWQGHGLGATFDVSDMMMRRHGIDPYSSYKLKVLDQTRDERYAMGKRYRTQQLAQSRQLMQKNLERLLATARDAATLKQGLFELWDDCAETGSDELVAGGRSAREQLIGYVRSKLRADSSDAFTPAELARLNKQRKSQAIFAPYE